MKVKSSHGALYLWNGENDRISYIILQFVGLMGLPREQYQLVFEGKALPEKTEICDHHLPEESELELLPFDEKRAYHD